MEIIYIYTLSDSKGVRYIGQSKKPKDRLYRHIHEAKNNGGKNKRCSWIKSLINSGGRPIMEIIDEVTINEWVFWEMYWIDQFKQWGFDLVNDTLGGEGSYGRVISKATKLKMSLAKKGKVPKNLEQLKKSRVKPILQYDLDGNFLNEFESVNYAKNNLDINNISRVLNKKSHTAGGYIWRYVGDELTNDELNLIKKSLNKQKPKPVLQYDLDGVLIKEWSSVNEIKKKYKHINAVLRGDRRTAGGYKWVFKNK